MCEEYSSVLSTLLRLRKSAVLADTDISVKPKYQPTYRSVSTKKILNRVHRCVLVNNNNKSLALARGIALQQPNMDKI